MVARVILRMSRDLGRSKIHVHVAWDFGPVGFATKRHVAQVHSQWCVFLLGFK